MANVLKTTLILASLLTTSAAYAYMTKYFDCYVTNDGAPQECSTSFKVQQEKDLAWACHDSNQKVCAYSNQKVKASFHWENRAHVTTSKGPRTDGVNHTIFYNWNSKHRTITAHLICSCSPIQLK